MGRNPGFRGVYAVAWSQTELGEERALPPEFMSVGMSWAWRGRAWRLDKGPETLWLDRPLEPADPRGRARERIRRMKGLVQISVQHATPAPVFAARPDPTEATAHLYADTGLPPDSFVLTDGERLYHARLLRQPGRLLAVFDPLMPPPGRMLWVSAFNPAPATPTAPGPRAGVICFLPGTRIDTVEGSRPVEMLAPGDRVLTRDNGPQPVVWRGATQLTGAELYLHPHLRPVRIRAGALGTVQGSIERTGRPDADLLVSPGHRLLLGGAGDAFGTPEVLVAAADLEDGRLIRRDFAPAAVTYVHLMFARHEIITANGLPCESFHPALADAGVLKWHARALERAAPGLLNDPERFGPAARRCLDRGEARILLHAAAQAA
ncbi:Hint domain-containing protein [Pararhodobacter sp.]|uniref:Hint domain-containing protein n=1 Tax=Pararhodobacter sp. TaxID=2127056 RepID=UPI002FDC829C